MEIDKIDQGLIQAWSEHHKERPDAPAQYLTEVDHLRIRMDQWEREEQGFIAIIGPRLARKALQEAMGDE